MSKNEDTNLYVLEKCYNSMSNNKPYRFEINTFNYVQIETHLASAGSSNPKLVIQL